jgi:hypothetical protein
MSGNAWLILQIMIALLAAASAFGVLLSAMLMRGRLAVDHPQSAVFDIAHTDRSYQIASIIASIGAMASYPHSTGAFASFIGVAVSFQIAEHWMLPRMQEAAVTGSDLPFRGVRARLELLQAACLALLFFKLGMPPLITLANVYGL